GSSYQIRGTRHPRTVSESPAVECQVALDFLEVCRRRHVVPLAVMADAVEPALLDRTVPYQVLRERALRRVAEQTRVAALDAGVEERRHPPVRLAGEASGRIHQEIAGPVI